MLKMKQIRVNVYEQSLNNCTTKKKVRSFLDYRSPRQLRILDCL